MHAFIIIATFLTVLPNVAELKHYSDLDLIVTFPPYNEKRNITRKEDFEELKNKNCLSGLIYTKSNKTKNETEKIQIPIPRPLVFSNCRTDKPICALAVDKNEDPDAPLMILGCFSTDIYYLGKDLYIDNLRIYLAMNAATQIEFMKLIYNGVSINEKDTKIARHYDDTPVGYEQDIHERTEHTETLKFVGYIDISYSSMSTKLIIYIVLIFLSITWKIVSLILSFWKDYINGYTRVLTEVSAPT